MPPDDRGGDLVLAQGTYAFVQNRSDTGEVTISVGPAFVTLSGNDTLVTMDRNGSFQPAGREGAIFQCIVARKGQYVVLHNPSFRDENRSELSLPGKGKAQKAPNLEFGHQVPVPGPISMALWPGQTAAVIEGCRLRLNDYVIVEVFDEAEAREHWSQAVLEVQHTGSVESDAEHDQGEMETAPSEDKTAPVRDVPTSGDVVTEAFDASQLVQGQRLVITGDRYRFFIPPRGVRVVPDEQGNHVRAAVTLELLEYCVLQDEGGTKRYVVGPAVVYPRPTENFREITANTDEGTRTIRSFRGIPLTDISGVHVQALTDHDYLNGMSLTKGREYFFTGKDTGVYMPNADQAIITYGQRDGGGRRRKVHYAVDLPDAGTGRYVMDRQTGEVKLVIGPKMFLPNPVDEVIVQRSLNPRMVELLYPGNQEAQAANSAIREKAGLSQAGEDQIGSSRASSRGQRFATDELEEEPLRETVDLTRDADDIVAGDLIDRPSRYTPPRSVVLDSSKYDGAVRVELWPGYAILIVNSNGERRVEVGPKVVLLEYGENVQVIELSKGTPKSAGQMVADVYLRTDNNTVSDEIVVETADLVDVKIRLSYQVDFVTLGEDAEEQAESRFRWFAVRNYVQFLADRIRSLVRRDVGRRTVQEFNQNSSDILRDLILGKAAEDGSGRPGRFFSENNMLIRDLDVLDVDVQDIEVMDLLERDQRTAVQQTLLLQQAERERDLEAQLQVALQATSDARHATTLHTFELQEALAVAQQEGELADIERRTARLKLEIMNKIDSRKLEDEAELARQQALDTIAQAELLRDKAESDEELRVAKERLQQEFEKIVAEVDAEVKRAGAVSEDLIAALKVFGDQDALARMAEAMAPMALLGGKSVVNVVSTLFGNLPGMEELIAKLGKSFALSGLAEEA